MFGDASCVDLPPAVVPIVVNAGAALLPAILAGVASCAAVLLNPREFLRICRTKPWIPALTVVVASVLGALIWFWPAAPNQVANRRGRPQTAAPYASGATANIDWTKIALARIAAQGQSPPQKVAPIADAAAPDAAAPTTSDQAFVFRGGPQRLGSIGADVQGSLRLAWHYYPRWIDETGAELEDDQAMILSSPAFNDDRVYGASCMLDPPDSYGAIFCLDSATGEQIWSVSKIDGEDVKGFFSSPALTADGRYLVIGQGLHPDTNCRLICLDADNGNVAWTLPVSLHIESSPAIDGDVAYVGCGAIEDPTTHKPLSEPGFVLAVRISDGEELWRYEVIDPESSPVVEDGVLYIGSGFNGQAVVALHTAPEHSNRLLWRRETPYPITGAITLLDDAVIAGGGNGDFVYRDPEPAGIVMALDKQTGEVRWSTELPDAVLGAVAADEALICPVASGDVVALDPSNGEERWATAVNGHAPVLAACAVVDSSVYAVSQDGYLARLDRVAGDVLEKEYINSTQRPGEQGLCISSPLAAHGRLYVGSETGGLRCYVGGSEP